MCYISRVAICPLLVTVQHIYFGLPQACKSIQSIVCVKSSQLYIFGKHMTYSLCSGLQWAKCKVNRVVFMLNRIFLHTHLSISIMNLILRNVLSSANNSTRLYLYLKRNACLKQLFTDPEKLYTLTSHAYTQREVQIHWTKYAEWLKIQIP